MNKLKKKEKKEIKRIFDQIELEDFKRIAKVLQDGAKICDIDVSYVIPIGINRLTRYRLDLFNNGVRSGTIELDSNLMIYYRRRGKNEAVVNLYFAYKELFAIIAEKGL